MRTILFAFAVVFGLAVSTVVAAKTPISKKAKAYIVWPKDGTMIHGGKLWVRMGIKNAGVAPAGIEKANTGHHHLIVDAPLPPFDQEIPADKNHLHFGAGQTEVRLELPPGTHTLQLLFADHEHIPHDPPIHSRQITIIVP